MRRCADSVMRSVRGPVGLWMGSLRGGFQQTNCLAPEGEPSMEICVTLEIPKMVFICYAELERGGEQRR